MFWLHGDGGVSPHPHQTCCDLYLPDKYFTSLQNLLTGSEASLSMVLRLTPRGVDGGGMTVSSRVVLLPSTTEAASMLGSSMMVWSEGRMSKINIRNPPHRGL